MRGRSPGTVAWRRDDMSALYTNVFATSHLLTMIRELCLIVSTKHDWSTHNYRPVGDIGCLVTTISQRPETVRQPSTWWTEGGRKVDGRWTEGGRFPDIAS